jgi:NAD(P)-dependent dehydrogenase (short-subunit alcohol dehydrogenase family)
MRFDGKLAVVSGANSGIGRASALRLMQEGAHVLAVDVDKTTPWPESVLGQIYPLTLDVASPDAPRMVADALVTQERAVHILVNAAGILKVSPFLDVSRSEWDRVLAVNLTGVFFLTQAVSQLMISAGTRGRVVNVSSVHAIGSEPNAAHYTASKGGMEAMTRTIATELAPHGITANCVRPGATWTAMSRPLYTEPIISALQARIPIGEIAQPEWVAAAICYLASDDAAYTTGACVDVDGGYGMNGALPNIAYH